MGALDPRVTEYARLLVERSLDVQPGWQVLIRTQPDARPVAEELIRLIAARGAYPLLRMNWRSSRTTRSGRPRRRSSWSARWPRSTGTRPTTWTRGSRSKRRTTPAARPR